jgi:hypothetical protein
MTMTVIEATLAAGLGTASTEGGETETAIVRLRSAGATAIGAFLAADTTRASRVSHRPTMTVTEATPAAGLGTASTKGGAIETATARPRSATATAIEAGPATGTMRASRAIMMITARAGGDVVAAAPAKGIGARQIEAATTARRL